MTSSKSTVVLQKDIYHGLPDLSTAPQGLTAIVTGANGISGAHMIRVLAESPQRWTKIYAMSRRPPSGTWPKIVEHIPVDFLRSPGEIATILRDCGIKPDFVFFFSYVLVTDDKGALQWDDPRLVEQNNLLLSNFLEALPLASAIPKRVFIQFGQKWHGVHLGATNIPDEEDDPRIDLEANLYYTQHDILAAFTAKHDIRWNSAFPSFVIGCTPDSTQTLVYPLFIYASVQKYLGRPLEYPSDLNAWYAPQSLSNAVLNSYLYEWSVLAPTTENQAFNASDGCAFTWGKAWPRIAAYFGMEWRGPASPEDVLREKGMKYEPPPHGRGRRSTMRYKFSFVEWAKDPEILSAWRELVRQHGLRDQHWSDVGSVFGRADFCLHRPYPSILSTTKATKAGFFGFVDSYQSILAVADEFVAAEIIPDPKTIGVRAERER